MTQKCLVTVKSLDIRGALKFTVQSEGSLQKRKNKQFKMTIYAKIIVILGHFFCEFSLVSYTMNLSFNEYKRQVKCYRFVILESTNPFSVVESSFEEKPTCVMPKSIQCLHSVSLSLSLLSRSRGDLLSFSSSSFRESPLLDISSGIARAIRQLIQSFKYHNFSNSFFVILGKSLFPPLFVTFLSWTFC